MQTVATVGQLPSCLYPHEKGKQASISQDLRSGEQKPDPNVVAPCRGASAQSDLFTVRPSRPLSHRTPAEQLPEVIRAVLTLSINSTTLVFIH